MLDPSVDDKKEFIREEFIKGNSIAEAILVPADELKELPKIYGAYAVTAKEYVGCGCKKLDLRP
jgi:hypothetical protein